MTTRTGFYESSWIEWEFEIDEVTVISTIDDATNDAIDLTLQQDTDGDGTVENSATFALTGGEETLSLTAFEKALGGSYAVRLDFEANEDEGEPSVSEIVAPAPNGLLVGFLTDEVGDEIPYTTVRAINAETDAVVVTQTDADGRYEFEFPDGGQFHVVTSYSTAEADYNAKSLPYIEVDPE